MKVCPSDGTALATQTQPITLPPDPPPYLAAGSTRKPKPDEWEDELSEVPAASGNHQITAAARPRASQSRPSKKREDRAEDAIGRILGSYKLIQVIGRGGMGRVYLAEHVRLGRRVALKLLRPEYAVKRDAVARFFQEAKAVNKIRHRNIVDVTDFVELDDGTTFIIMELLEGQSLGRIQRTSGSIEIPRLLAILAQVCDALEAAHSVGIVHRDLKPDNVFVVSDGAGGEQAKLLDFGVAKLLSREDEEADDEAWQTAAGSVVGTPAYMSPEQAGGLEIDRRSDVYSLGAIMYELLCGQPLFQGRSFGDFVMKHMNEPVVPPRQTKGGKEIPPRLEEIVLRCVEKKREDRYPSTGALRDDLLGLLAQYDTGMVNLRAIVHSWPGKVATPQPIVIEAPDEDRTDPKPVETHLTIGDLRSTGTRRARAWPWVAAFAFVAAGVGVVLYFALVHGPARPPATAANVGAPAPTVGPITTPLASPLPDPKPDPAARPPERAASTEVKVSFKTDPAGASVHFYGSSSTICVTPCSHVIDPLDGGDPKLRTFVLVREGFVEHQEDVPLDGGGEISVHAILVAIPLSTTPVPSRDRDRPRDRDRDRDRDRPPQPPPAPTEVPPPPGSDKIDIDRTETLNPFNKPNPSP